MPTILPAVISFSNCPDVHIYRLGAYMPKFCPYFRVQVIEAALCDGSLDDLCKFQQPKDPGLLHTSSWRNEFLEICSQPLDYGRPDKVLPEQEKNRS